MLVESACELAECMWSKPVAVRRCPSLARATRLLDDAMRVVDVLLESLESELNDWRVLGKARFPCMKVLPDMARVEPSKNPLNHEMLVLTLGLYMQIRVQPHTPAYPFEP